MKRHIVMTTSGYEMFFTAESASHFHERNIREGKQSFLCEIECVDAHPVEQEMTAAFYCLIDEE